MSDTAYKKFELIIKSLNKEITRKATSATAYDVSLENYIILELCRNPSITPSDISYKLESNGIYKDANEIISILRSDHFFLGNPTVRKEFFEKINALAETIVNIMHDCENPENIEKLDNIKFKDYVIEKAKGQYIHKIIIIAVFNAEPELRDSECFRLLLNTFGKTYCIHLIASLMQKIRQLSQLDISQPQKKLTENEKIEALMEENDRVNQMLAELNDEFAERLEKIKRQELTEFFSMLNSEKYNFIIDEMFLLRKGFNALRKKNYELPPEIMGIAVAMNNFMQLIKDVGIAPMIMPETVMEVTMEHIDDYQYQGTPFTDIHQKKKVLVVSPGWIWKEKDLIISRPKVREIE
ncbi:MAG: hypothetical protein ACI4JM_12390 [Oscillospiraceae bacterium]